MSEEAPANKQGFEKPKVLRNTVYDNVKNIGIQYAKPLIVVLSTLISLSVVLLITYIFIYPYFKGVKYILVWNFSKDTPLSCLSNVHFAKCKFSNCFVTNYSTYFGEDKGEDFKMFDAIVFGPDVVRTSKEMLPKMRFPHQKFIFASIDSADNYPVCSNKFDGFFNWTWTYRLDSEIKWTYMIIKDKDNNVIGPRKDMHWIKFEDMDPVSKEFKEKLRSKSKAAAWFMPKCCFKSECIVDYLQKELEKYNLTLDIYSSCRLFNYSQFSGKHCDILKQKYYFYLSFETSFDEDFVTDQLLNSIQHDTVPIVSGRANYSRFMPDGMYLNAKELEANKLAEKMYYLIKHPDEYAEYFRWKKYYSYHKQSEDADTDEYCSICAMLNDEEKVKQTSVYHNFRKWWDPPGRC